MPYFSYNSCKIIIYVLIIIGLTLGVFAVSIQAANDEREIKAIRKVLIVPVGQLEKGIKKSKELGVPEVAEGIPPALKDKVTEDMLPYVYEEIIYEEPDTLSEEMKKAIKKLGADIAEYYPVLDESIEAGDVVSVSSQSGLIMSVTSTKYLVEKTSQPYDQKLMGVISGNSAMVINAGDSTDPEVESTLRPVALTGRVLVKVSLENGPIEIGDYLTSASSTLGVAMKATKPGQVIGMALESFDGTLTKCETENIEIGEAGEVENCQTVETEIGKIMVFINVGWHEGEFVIEEGGFSFSNLFISILEQFKKLGIFIEQNLVRVKRIITAALVIERGPVLEENTIGEGVIPSGTSETMIYNNNVTPTSKIFITFRSDYQGRWWASEISEGYFKITLSEVALQDIPFDYWIVGVGESVLEGNLGLPPEEPPASQPQNFYYDSDKDGYGVNSNFIIGYEPQEGYVPNMDDCDDSNPEINPGTTEICDGIDNNCDGQTDEGGACEAASPPAEDVCDATHLNLCFTETDCIHVGGFWYNEACNTETEEPEEPVCEPTEEICDGIDNDCDGLIDEDLKIYSGTDEGECQQGIMECIDGVMVETQTEIGPTAEICDGTDNNCDGQIDEGGVCEAPTLPEEESSPEPET